MVKFFVAQQPLIGQGLLIEAHEHTQTHHIREGSSGRVIILTQRHYLTTHNTHKRDMHAPGEIQTRNHSKRDAADPRLGPRSHCGRLRADNTCKWHQSTHHVTQI